MVRGWAKIRQFCLQIDMVLQVASLNLTRLATALYSESDHDHRELLWR